MDAALQGAPVVDQMESEAGPLALCADTWIGQPDLGHEVPAGKLSQHMSVDLVGLGSCVPFLSRLSGDGDPIGVPLAGRGLKSRQRA
jgi:hypothetical protein